MLDLQRGYARLLNILGLHIAHHTAPLIAQPPCGIQRGIVARGDIAAIAQHQRRFCHQGAVQQVYQPLMPPQRA